MKFLQIFTAAVSFVFAGLSMAGNLTIPNTFVASETARAAEVNANFTAVKTEVDDNSARIDLNASDIAFKQDRVSGSCPANEFMRVISPDGVVGCLAINPAVTQNRVSGACASGESIRTVNADGSVDCEQDDDTQYTADANGIKGITLDGNEFRLADGYVSVPYSAFVATNVQRTDVQDIVAYWGGNPVAQVFSSLGSINYNNPGFPTEVTNANHPQLQVCQLAHQISDTAAYTYFVNNGNTYCDAIAPLNLPHNALLSSLFCKVSENSASNSLQVKLYRVPLDGDLSTQEEIFSSETSINQDPPQEITASLVDDNATLVENNRYAYHLQMLWETNILGSEYKVYGCSVGYTY